MGDNAAQSAAQSALNQPVPVDQYKHFLMEVIALATVNLSELESHDYASAFLSGVSFMVEQPINQGAS